MGSKSTLFWLQEVNRLQGCAPEYQSDSGREDVFVHMAQEQEGQLFLPRTEIVLVFSTRSSYTSCERTTTEVHLISRAAKKCKKFFSPILLLFLMPTNFSF